MAIIPSGVFFMQEKQNFLSRQTAHHSSRAFASPGIRTTFPSSMTAKKLRARHAGHTAGFPNRNVASSE